MQLYTPTDEFMAGENMWLLRISFLSWAIITFLIVTYTRRKEIENQLKQIQTAVNNATDAILITNQKGKVIYINLAFGNLFKYSSESTDNIEFSSIFVDTKIAVGIYRGSLNGDIWTGETQMVSSSGKVFPAFLRSTPITDDRQNNLGVLFIINDINELKDTERRLEDIVAKRTEELAKEKQLLDVTMSSMSDAVIALNVEMRVVLFNRVAEQMTGLRFQDVEGKFIGNVLAVVDNNTKEPVDDIIGKILNADTDNPDKGNYTLIHKNGTEYVIACNASVMSVDENSIMGTVLAFRDVTKERRIDQMKTDFVSSVSHELKTPLTSIKAFTTTILRDPNMTDENRRQFLGIIDEESNRLADLIEDLLEISRIESGSLQISLELVDISDVFNQTAISLETLAAKENIKLIKNIPENLPPLTADPGKLRSVITNLISNAVKFTPDGGRVDIKAQQKDDELEVTVSDTGMGIPQEDLPKIFDRFYRVNRPGQEIQGTGLGLAIVKKIVEMHNGRIEVRSKVNKGTTFTVYLPLAKEAATV
jgi:two-component system phosphate regulon sensor histidine kinase PhoR